MAVDFGLNPTVVLTHAATFTSGKAGNDSHFVLTRQFYSSRYLDASISLTASRIRTARQLKAISSLQTVRGQMPSAEYSAGLPARRSKPRPLIVSVGYLKHRLLGSLSRKQSSGRSMLLSKKNRKVGPAGFGRIGCSRPRPCLCFWDSGVICFPRNDPDVTPSVVINDSSCLYRYRATVTLRSGR